MILLKTEPADEALVQELINRRIGSLVNPVGSKWRDGTWSPPSSEIPVATAKPIMFDFQFITPATFPTLTESTIAAMEIDVRDAEKLQLAAEVVKRLQKKHSNAVLTMYFGQASHSLTEILSRTQPVTIRTAVDPMAMERVLR